jgi:hypothetical protein
MELLQEAVLQEHFLVVVVVETPALLRLLLETVVRGMREVVQGVAVELGLE